MPISRSERKCLNSVQKKLTTMVRIKFVEKNPDNLGATAKHFPRLTLATAEGLTTKVRFSFAAEHPDAVEAAKLTRSHQIKRVAQVRQVVG